VLKELTYSSNGWAVIIISQIEIGPDRYIKLKLYYVCAHFKPLPCDTMWHAHGVQTITICTISSGTQDLCSVVLY